MAPKKSIKTRKEFIISKVNIHELSHVELLKFTENLYHQYEAEQITQNLHKTGQEAIDVFLKTANDTLSTFVFDVKDSYKAVAEKSKAVLDMKNRIRVQHEKFTVDKGQQVDRIRAENERCLMRMAAKNARETRQLKKRAADFREFVDNHKSEQLNAIQMVKTDCMKRTYENMGKMEKTAARALRKMMDESMYSNLENDAVKRRFLDRITAEFDWNTRATIGKFSREMTFMRDQCIDKNRTLVCEIDRLTEELEKLKNRNELLGNQVAFLTKNNVKLGAEIEALNERNVIVEKKLKNYDNCQKTTDTCLKELKKYKQLFKYKKWENEILEDDNADMKRGFRKYDECFIDVLLSLNEQCLLNKKLKASSKSSLSKT